jgi:glutathione S-transferase
VRARAVQYLDDKYGAEPTRLLPDDAVQRAKARSTSRAVVD